MKTTDYFQTKVLEKRPYIKPEWCIYVLHNPIKTVTQPNGRIRHWAYIAEIEKYLRVVTLEDGMTILNAFPDRRFKP